MDDILLRVHSEDLHDHVAQVTSLPLWKYILKILNLYIISQEKILNQKPCVHPIRSNLVRL